MCQVPQSTVQIKRASADEDSHDVPTTISTIDPSSILLSKFEASIKTKARQSIGRG